MSDKLQEQIDAILTGTATQASGPMQSWKVHCWTRGDSQPATNAIRFATKEEGEAYASDLYSRWTALDRYEVVQSVDPVTDRWTGKLEPVA